MASAPAYSPHITSFPTPALPCTHPLPWLSYTPRISPHAPPHDSPIHLPNAPHQPHTACSWASRTATRAVPATPPCCSHSACPPPSSCSRSGLSVRWPRRKPSAACPPVPPALSRAHIVCLCRRAVVSPRTWSWAAQPDRSECTCQEASVEGCGVRRGGVDRWSGVKRA